MNTEEDEFRRIEAEAKRRAARDEDDDTQVYAKPCIGKDPRCPCQDGDACHYKDCGSTKALPVPVAQRPWVGLTEFQFAEIYNKWNDTNGSTAWGLNQALEAKLRKLNT